MKIACSSPSRTPYNVETREKLLIQASNVAWIPDDYFKSFFPQAAPK